MLGLLVHSVVFITLLVLSIRAMTRILRQSEIFKEFGQSRVLAFLTVIFPAGPVLILFGNGHLSPVLIFSLVAICYVPAFLVAKRQSSAFEVAGTDRVRQAQEAVSSAFSGALIGLIYSAFVLILSIAAYVYAMD